MVVIVLAVMIRAEKKQRNMLTKGGDNVESEKDELTHRKEEGSTILALRHSRNGAKSCCDQLLESFQMQAPAWHRIQGSESNRASTVRDGRGMSDCCRRCET